MMNKKKKKSQKSCCGQVEMKHIREAQFTCNTYTMCLFAVFHVAYYN